MRICFPPSPKENRVMRVYKDFQEAKNEITRDLNELGNLVFAGYQSKATNKLNLAKFQTKELLDYDYIVLRPSYDDLEPSYPWVAQEWEDRMRGIKGAPVNPGESWKCRPEIWEPLLEYKDDEGIVPQVHFSYTYSERLSDAGIPDLIQALKLNPYSRQVWVSIWNPVIDGPRLGLRRVPCSLGYQIFYRNNAVNMAYHMRSSDFKTHFDNDVWLALKLLEYFCHALEQPMGNFVHKIGSLHVYASQVAGVF